MTAASHAAGHAAQSDETERRQETLMKEKERDKQPVK
jgi:hypothetical protein